MSGAAPGSYQPPSSGGKGGLTTLEIVLIAVGAGAGGLMLLGCVVLVSYLACFRTPPVAQVGRHAPDGVCDVCAVVK